MKRLVLLTVFCSLVLLLNAQENSECMNVDYQYNKEGLKIRWVFSDYISWKNAVRNGMHIESVEFDEDLNVVNKKVIFDTLKPATLETLKSQFGKDNLHAAVAAQMLYGKSQVTGSEDFGSFIKNKKTEQEVIHSTAMFIASLNFEVATAVALGMQEKVEHGKIYLYKMFVWNTDCDTMFLSVTTHQYTEPTGIASNLQAAPGEKSVHLSWDASQSDLLGYYVEKSAFNENNFVRLNTDPLILIENEFNRKNLVFNDTLEMNYLPFQYRLVGVNAFGDQTAPSEAIVSMGRDVTPPPAPVITKIVSKPNDYLSIMWKPIAEVSDFKTYNVLRSHIFEGPYIQLNTAPLLKETMIFNDTNPEPVLPNFYVIEAVDTAGNSATSFAVQGNVIDTIPPACPKAMFADSISDGNYTLVWGRPVEQDILGYRVYFANARDHVFTLISDVITDTVFKGQITLNTLTEKAFFKIGAVDFHYNESGDCNIIELSRKDTIKPTNAVFNEVQILQNSVSISWIPSDSWDCDSVFITRKSDLDTTWVQVFGGKNSSDSLFIDHNVLKNNGYEYMLSVKDKNNNQSESSLPYRIVIAEQQALKGVDKLKITSTETEKQLNWEGELSNNQSFIVYVSEDGGLTMTIIGRTNADHLTLEKRFSNENYSFAVCVIDDQGRKSLMTDWVK